jgi:hypothetical protein
LSLQRKQKGGDLRLTTLSLLHMRSIKLRLFRQAHKKKALLAQDLSVFLGWIMGLLASRVIPV